MQAPTDTPPNQTAPASGQDCSGSNDDTCKIVRIRPVDEGRVRLDPRHRQSIADQIARADAMSVTSTIADTLCVPAAILNSILRQYHDPERKAAVEALAMRREGM